MRYILIPLLLLCGACWPAPAPAQVKRCALPDGSLIYTDRRCEDIGARNRVAPISASVGGAVMRTPRCPRNPQELADALSMAIQSGDANRVAALYDWTGIGTTTANTLMDRLQAMAERSLLDVQILRSSPAASELPEPLAFDESSGKLLTPAPATARPKLLGLQVQQTQKNGYTAVTTRFGLRQRMDCWWIHL